MSADAFGFIAKNQDQVREGVNTRQRFEAFLDARRRKDGYKGSMLFTKRDGIDVLIREQYEGNVRKQKILGPRNAETEAIQKRFLDGRDEANELFKGIQEVIQRQSGVNRALNLGRIPEIGAKIIRAIDGAGLLGKGVKVIGTNAMFAYEANAEVFFPSELTSTEDIDMLFDARANIRFLSDEPSGDPSILGLLNKIDRSFVRAPNAFSAYNKDGYIVDLVRPQRNPPWKEEPTSVGGKDGDLEAVMIGGLSWHENAPTFEAVAIDTRGFPVRIVAPDPRAFAVHKHWMSKRDDRRPDKRARDRYQAKIVAAMVSRYMPHLPFDPDILKSFPKDIVDDAAHLFTADEPTEGFNF